MPTKSTDQQSENRSSVQLKGQKNISQSFETIMQRRLMKFLIQSISKQIVIRYKNGQIATGLLHSLDTEKLSIIVKNYYGYDQKKEYKKILFGDIDYFKVTINDSADKSAQGQTK